MSSPKSQQAPGFPKKSYRFELPADVTATANPLFRIYMPQACVPISCRITPLTEFDFTTGNETYVLSVEDDDSKISTDNTAIAAGNKTAVMEATFALTNAVVAAGSYVDIVVTLGGTTPIIPARSVVELDVLEV